MISKKQLEILLERCTEFAEPKAKLEQYVTPTPIAADLLNLAALKGDIAGRKVFDLGCGTGRLGIGAELLGAAEVIGFDVDCEVIDAARQNAEALGAVVTWKCLDVTVIDETCHTVIMNPPFGVKAKGADRPFIKAALKVGKVIYTMHKTTTRDFITEYIKRCGGAVTDLAQVKFNLPHSYSFHKKRIKRIEVDIYRIERRD
jgi:putative methylase